MPKEVNLIIEIKSLNRLFEANTAADSICCQGLCSICGCQVEVKITASGYGLSGGILYEKAPDFEILCVDCHKNGADRNMRPVRTGNVYG